MVNLMESKLPEIYVRGLDEEYDALLAASHVDKIVTTFFEGVSNCLKDAKSENCPVAVAFENLKGETIACAVVSFHAGESGNPGSWSYVWSFGKDAIPEGARVLKIADTQVQQYISSVAGNRFSFGFEKAHYIINMANYFFKVLDAYLQDNVPNARGEEEVGVVLDGVFIAKVEIEDGEVVKSITPVGETKTLVKGDSDIEVR